MITTAEKLVKLKEWLTKTKLDADVVGRTLGVQEGSITADVMLLASAKLIKVNRHEVEPDDRDNLRFSRFLGLEDYVAEHILKDAGHIQKKAAMKMQQKRNLSWLSAGFFTPQVRSTIIGNALSQNVDGINPTEHWDNSHRVTKLGPGGIPCFSDDTEVLTAAGWKMWPTVQPEDQIACCISGRLEFRLPVKLISQHYLGDMYCAHTERVNYMVTPNHRLWCAASTSKFAFETAAEVHGLTRSHLTDCGHELGGGRVPAATGVVDGDQSSTKPYDGMVYCAEVPGGLLFTRRNGKTFWSGNSTDSIPQDSRQISTSSFGFFDPVHIMESDKVGVTNFMTHNVVKGRDNKLYRVMKQADGKLKWFDHETILDRQVVVPEV